MKVNVFVVREDMTWEFCGVYGTRAEAESQRTKCGAEHIEEDTVDVPDAFILTDADLDAIDVALGCASIECQLDDAVIEALRTKLFGKKGTPC